MSFSPEPDDDDPNDLKSNDPLKSDDAKEGFWDRKLREENIVVDNQKKDTTPVITKEGDDDRNDNEDKVKDDKKDDKKDDEKDIEDKPKDDVINKTEDQTDPKQYRDPRLASRISRTETARNGVDSKVWNDVFHVEKVSDAGKLSLDITGLHELRSTMRQPMKIGEYSLLIDSKTNTRQFLNDSTEMKYLHAPPFNAQVCFDLSHGYDKDINWGECVDVRVDELLRWILLNRKKFMVNGEPKPGDLHTDFVTYRGVFTKIMTAPYENNEQWLICATKFRGTIYMCQFKVETEQFPPPDDFYNRLSYSGYRFEQYLCSPFEDIPPDPNVVDLDHNQFCCVVRSRLWDDRISHSYIFGAEMDGAIPHLKEPPGTLGNFIEIKTTKQITSEYQYKSFIKHKLLKWWAQSYLVGVPKIYCGYRDPKLFVKQTEALHIDQFPNLCAAHWSPNVCLNFLNRFLTFVKSCITIDDPNVVYQFHFQPHQDITCKRLSDPGNYQILPDWYIQQF